MRCLWEVGSVGIGIVYLTVGSGQIHHGKRRIKEERKFIDEVLPHLTRLPQSVNDGKMPAFFTDTLTFGDANLFFSGLGKIIISLCPSLGIHQRAALNALIDATAPVLMPVLFRSDLPALQLAMARAQTRCEIHLPLAFNTMAQHAFLEVFEPSRGRVIRAGSCPHFHMAAMERFNKKLRSLLTQMKSPAVHLMMSWRRLNMTELYRVAHPVDHFPTVPGRSTVMGAAREGAALDAPDYILAEHKVRLRGQTKFIYMTDVQRERVHLWFLDNDVTYARAHAKLRGIT